MRKPWISFILLAAVIFGAAVGIDYYRHRLVRSDRDLFSFLPQTNATVFFVNVDTLRRAGILRLLAGAATAKDSDYSAFVRETHFDYTKDINAIAGSADAAQVCLLIRGRFDWTLLRGYARKHGGRCKNRFCETPSSTTGRWASFFPLQPDVMALAISGNRVAARVLRDRHEITRAVPQEPLWVSLSQAVLKNTTALPTAIRIFAISLQSADSVVLSLGPASPPGEAEFQLQLKAECANAITAQSMRNQLELETKFLKLAFARQHTPPNGSDLGTLLTQGSFRASGNKVFGNWPISKELLNSLQ